MLTEDITVPQDGTWLEVALTSTRTILYNGSGVELMARFGATSTSSGFMLFTNESMSVDEPVWIRPSELSMSKRGPFKITVTR
jgi:hypothetical protein